MTTAFTSRPAPSRLPVSTQPSDQGAEVPPVTPVTRERATRPRLDEVELEGRVRGILNRWPSVGFALGVVQDGRLAFFSGHGVADLVTNAPVTEDTIFRIASITKTFTAIAILQLHERRLIDLDAPANEYLKSYELVPASSTFRPATVRHLLTHTAGIAELVRPSDLFRPDWGDSVTIGSPMPTLAAFYQGAIRLDFEPGTTWIYSNHGYATLGQIVEDVTGQPLAAYFREHIFEPLGMADTDLVRSDEVRARLAVGYRMSRRGPEAIADREWVTAGASSIYSTIRDMSRYVAALLGGGANEHGRILEPTTLGSMFAAHHQPDPRVPGMGLGFDRNSVGGHQTIGHGGILPGFNTQLFVAPDDGVGVIAFTNGSSQAMLWLPTELGRLLGHLVGAPEDALRTDVPHHPEIWPDIVGRYELRGRMSDIRARMMLGGGASVSVWSGRPVLRILSPVPWLLAGLPLHPDDERDPYVFRVDLARFGLPTARVVFHVEPGKGATSVHLDLLPIALFRRTPSGRDRAARERAARAAATAWTASLVATGVVRMIRRRRRGGRARRTAAQPG